MRSLNIRVSRGTEEDLKSQATFLEITVSRVVGLALRWASASGEFMEADIAESDYYYRRAEREDIVPLSLRLSNDEYYMVKGMADRNRTNVSAVVEASYMGWVTAHPYYDYNFYVDDMEE